MCFIPKSKNSIRLKIARKNITCYKIVKRSEISEKIVFSLIYRYKYRIGDVYETTIGGIRRPNVTNLNIVVESGFHSFKHKPDAHSIQCNDEVIVKCTIPKGSIYAKNKKYYVSSHIVINEVIQKY